MIPPLLSYVTFNRLGLTVKNLSSILESTDDFEMHIIDNNSNDGTWEYLQTLKDERIKSKIRIGANYGPIYSLNINLSKRRPEQYFISVDNDIYIETKDWISRFIKVFETFPKAGLLGVSSMEPFQKHFPRVKQKMVNNTSYFQIENSFEDIEKNYVPGCCMMLRPELIDEIGYLSEENYFGDIELSYRVLNFTSFEAGFVPAVEVKATQTIDCNDCQHRDECKLNKTNDTCFSRYNALYKINEFKKLYRWKLDETITDLKSGARPVYCASSADEGSLGNNIYNRDWAVGNFVYFADNAN